MGILGRIFLKAIWHLLPKGTIGKRGVFGLDIGRPVIAFPGATTGNKKMAAGDLWEKLSRVFAVKSPRGSQADL